MVESECNSRNTAEVGWRDFITILKHHGRKRGCHVVAVDPADTTKECNRCGVKTDKQLWVREHSCPSCEFEVDRDYNAALNVCERGLDNIGVSHSEATSAETATAVEPAALAAVSARRVVESGSPCLKEPQKAASRQG